MPSNLSRKLRILLQKQADGQSSPEEDLVIREYYDLFEDAPNLTEQFSQEEINAIGESIKKGLDSNMILFSKPPLPFYRRYWWQLAASVLIILGAATLFVVSQRAGNYETAMLNTVEKRNPVILNHWILLPDGSKVVLRADSRLTVNTDFSKDATREVTLTGEAYFDVHHDPSKKFIIHTGNISTSVLGTAFNISAYPNHKVTVTVTRGKVAIERNQHLLGVLTPNHQLTADHSDVPNVISRTVEAIKVSQWTETDMHFDDIPFGQLADRLSKRYGLVITFKNEALKNCPISGNFSGRESLTEVLDILTKTTNASYTIQDSSIIIDGQGCNELKPTK